MTRRSIAVLFVVPTLITGTALFVQLALGQSGPLEVIPLAQGYSSEHRLAIRSKGPSDVLQAKVTLQPLGEIGWHTHPGPVIVVITKGALTEYNENAA